MDWQYIFYGKAFEGGYIGSAYTKTLMQEIHMPLTVGAVIFVIIVICILGNGDLAKGAKRFMIGQWLLLGVVLLGIGSVVLFTLGEAIWEIARG